MQRTTKAERKMFAKQFYQFLCLGGAQKAAIVIMR